MARVSYAALLLVLSIFYGFGNGQQNAQLRVPNSLANCYRDYRYLYAYNRVPNNIANMISIIQKLENNPAYTQDIRQLAVGLIQSFRQDGIERAPNVITTPTVLPYGPTGFQFPKFRVLISKLLPSNGQIIPNSTLSQLELCSLHFMLSSTIDRRVRGDEGTVCNQLSQYKAMRVPRDINTGKPGSVGHYDNNFLGDVELLDSLKGGKAQSGPLQYGGEFYPSRNDTTPVQHDVETSFDSDYPNGGNGYGSGTNYGGTGGQPVSQCPLESGVIWTPWGSVTGGNLIAGIAAGLQPQTIQVNTLLQTFRRPGAMRANQQQVNMNVDNKWAATLAGDLAEVALLQGPSVTAGGQISLGASGAWNSSALPRYYFLSQSSRLEMTDAEIRGGLDGLILATNIANWRNQYSTLKLSQLLDMYYSQKGVLASGIRSCDRRGLFTSVAPVAQLTAQAIAFTNVLDREMQLRVTLDSDAIATFASNAAQSLATYIPQYLNDVSCYATMLVPNEQTIWNTATDVYIFVDTTWQFTQINPIIMYFLQNVNVNPYASRMTIMNAMDGTMIVPTTQYISDAYVYWNQTTHQQQPMGLNLANILWRLGNITYNLANSAQINSTSGGRSLVSLIVSNGGGNNQADSSYTFQQMQNLRTYSPDLKMLFVTGGSAARFTGYAQSTKDVLGLTPGGNVVSQTIPLILRVRDIPAALINYRCGPNWQTQQYGSAQLYQYVEPGSINFYRLLPNYFYGGGSNRYITIQGQASNMLTVCSSRYNAHPTSNSSLNYNYNQNQGNNNNNNNNNNGNNYQNDVNCTQIGSSSFTFDLNNVCNGYNRIMDCPPVYISVMAVSQSTNGQGGQGQQQMSSASCTDPMCRYPDQVRFSVQLNNLGCYSSATQVIVSFALVLFGTIFSYMFV